MGWDIEDVKRKRSAVLRRRQDVRAQCLCVAQFVVDVRAGLDQIGDNEGRPADGTDDTRNDSLPRVEVLVDLEGAEAIGVTDALESVVGLLEVSLLGE